METARIVSSPKLLRFSGTGGPGRLLLRHHGNSRVCFSARYKTQVLRNEFSDSGHALYYQSPVTGSGKKQKEKMKEIKTEKKKVKLIKRLTRDLDLFSQSAQGENTGGRLMISEATEVLLGELENLRTAEKEQKRKKKEDKVKLMKPKAMMESDTSSSSSSESSDCDEGKVINLRRLRVNSQPQFTEKEAEQTAHAETSAEAHSGNEISSIKAAEAVSNTKIEICMGGKCKKLGAPMLLEEFERNIGTEASVVGCKCMGKCKTGPNVRVSNSVNDIQEENIKCSAQTQAANPLYIGVGLEDVGAIVANLFSENRIDECLLPAS